MKKWLEKPYHSLDYMLQERFKEKVYKITLNGGMSCPNRDGTLGNRGCIFCSAGGSGDFAADPSQSVSAQIESQMSLIQKKRPVQKFIAYFQAYTNTYAPVSYLRPLFFEAIRHPGVVALSIGTRPDCLGEDVLTLLSELNTIKPVWVELGLQTIHEDTAAYIRRGYDLTCFENALKRLNVAQIPVIVHVILGLPGEDKEKMLETIRYLNNAGIFGIKLQLLHVLENTDLADEFRAGKFQTLSMEAYVDLVVSCIGALSPDIVIHRLTGDGPSNQLISPLWSRAKRSVLNCIHHELNTRGIYQGCFLKEQG